MSSLFFLAKFDVVLFFGCDGFLLVNIIIFKHILSSVLSHGEIVRQWTMVQCWSLVESDWSLLMILLMFMVMRDVSERSWSTEVWPLTGCHNLMIVWLWMRSLMSLMKAAFVMDWLSSLLMYKMLPIIMLVGILSMVKSSKVSEISTGKSAVCLRLSSYHFSWLLLSSFSNILPCS